MGQQILPGDLTIVDTRPRVPVGTEYIDSLGRAWKYVKGSATIVQYAFGVITQDGNYTISYLDTDTSGHGAGKSQVLGVPQMSAGLTSTTYGWVFVGNGLFTGAALASCVQNVPLYATSTGGSVDDTATTTLIPGCVVVTTLTGAANVSMYAAGRLYTAGI